MTSEQTLAEVKDFMTQYEDGLIDADQAKVYIADVVFRSFGVQPIEEVEVPDEAITGKVQ